MNTAAMDGKAALGRERAVAWLANMWAWHRHGVALRMRRSLDKRHSRILRKQTCRLCAPLLSPFAVAVLDKCSVEHSHHYSRLRRPSRTLRPHGKTKFSWEDHNPCVDAKVEVCCTSGRPWVGPWGLG